MSLYFIVKTGPQSGRKFPLKEGFIGRSRKSSLCLSDPKVSALHAKVIRKEDQWLLIDNNSFNGINCNGKRMKEISLSHGISFQVGKSLIEVQNVSETDFHSEKEEVSIFDFVDYKSTSSFRLRKEKKTPDKVLLHYIRQSIKEKSPLFQEDLKNFQRSMAPKPLNPSLHLTIVRGPQAGTKWHLTYAPRKVGRASVDFPIYDDKAPLQCFEILTSSHKALIKTKAKEVLLNESPFSSEIIQNGDIIDIRDTRIEIHFEEKKSKNKIQKNNEK